MTSKPYLDHRTLQKWVDETPRIKALMADPDYMDRIEPLSPAIVPDGSAPRSMGYMVAPDGRIAFRWCHSRETQEIFGVDALDTMEAVILTARIAQLFDIEQAALDAQADAVKLRRALVDMVASARKGRVPTEKELATAGRVLRETER